MSNENEKIQAELAEYNADVEKAIAKFPERPHLPEQRYPLWKEQFLTVPFPMSLS